MATNEASSISSQVEGISLSIRRMTVGENEDSDDSKETMENRASASSTKSRRTGLKVLFLSSDTGGGHRSSAEALAKQFEILFPGSTYELLDIVEKDGVPPYSSLVSAYKHLSNHPSQWKLVYAVSNSRAFEMLADAHLKLMCERAVRRTIKSYDPDVVVSVHPLMTNVPVLSCSKISNETGRHLPMFTVVTDLGSAHCLWFAKGVERMFVGSEQVKKLAMGRGRVPEDKLVLAGLPIRHDFAVESEKLGDRISPEGKAYQLQVRQDLGLPNLDRKFLLVMGGGEGVGSLSDIVDALYVELVTQGINAVVIVVCGRNEKLKESIESRDWVDVFKVWRAAKERHGLSSSLLSLRDACGDGFYAPSSGCIESGTVTSSIRRMLSTSSMHVASAMSTPLPEFVVGTPTDDEKKIEPDQQDVDSVQTKNSIEARLPGRVDVVGLGFVKRMAEYMVAADVLVTKAGPGTIVEAAALALPVMLTSFLPGQEEGNVDFVVDGGFGAYVNDADPIGIAEEVCMWLTDDDKHAMLSRTAGSKGAPYAARDIAQAIGDSTLKWREIDEHQASARAPGESNESSASWK